jgi:uncharacterized protein (DUF58 family)
MPFVDLIQIVLYVVLIVAAAKPVGTFLHSVFTGKRTFLHPVFAPVERGISMAASLAAAYLEVGWTVDLVARDLHVLAGTGRMHEAKIARALALLPYVGDDVPFVTFPKRIKRQGKERASIYGNAATR